MRREHRQAEKSLSKIVEAETTVQIDAWSRRIEQDDESVYWELARPSYLQPGSIEKVALMAPRKLVDLPAFISGDMGCREQPVQSKRELVHAEIMEPLGRGRTAGGFSDD